MIVMRYIIVAAVMLGASATACKGSSSVDSGIQAATSGDALPGAAHSDASGLADAGASDASPHDAALVTDDETVVPMTSEEWVTRSKHLVEAVAADNPELAIDFLLSKDAYTQLYAEYAKKDATRAWERHMKKPFERAIHRLHRRRHSKDAKFGRFELGTRLVKGPVGKGKQRRHVWHARGSRIFYTIEGREHHIAIREMIAWRGAWYISRLRQ